MREDHNNQSGSRKAQQTKGYTGAVGTLRGKSQAAAAALEALKPERVLQVLVLCVSAQAGLIIGTTRDGGCLAITLLYEDDRVRFYPHDPAEAAILLEDIAYWAGQEAQDRTLQYFIG